MQLNLAAIVTAKKLYPKFGKIEHFNTTAIITAIGKNCFFEGVQVDYHTIEFGFYPQDVCDEENTLEGLYSKGMLKKTGKSYVGQQVFESKWNYNDYDTHSQKTLKNLEYEYNGKKYVRVTSSYRDMGIVKDPYCRISEKARRYTIDHALKDGHKRPENGGVKWVEVKPIKWIIRNWNDMPKEINPQGTGKAKTMILRSELAINTMPYFILAPNEKKPHAQYKEIYLGGGIVKDMFMGYGSARGCIWQNSLLRAYLNGYNIAQELEKGNGLKSLGRKENFDFTDSGFLNEAFDYDLEKLYERRNKVSEEDETEKVFSKDDEELSL